MGKTTLDGLFKVKEFRKTTKWGKTEGGSADMRSTGSLSLLPLHGPLFRDSWRGRQGNRTGLGLSIGKIPRSFNVY